MGTETPADSTGKGSPAESAGTSETPVRRGWPARDEHGRIWFEAGDVASLTFDTGETIPAMWTRPRGTHAGWVLADGTRLRARPTTLTHIHIVYPPDRVAEEEITHGHHADTTD